VCVYWCDVMGVVVSTLLLCVLLHILVTNSNAPLEVDATISHLVYKLIPFKALHVFIGF